MRILLALIALAACAIAHAQRIDGSSSNVRPHQWRDREDWDERHRTPEPRPASTKSTDALISVPPAPTPPSPAEKMQRRMAEEQRLQREDQANIRGNFRCNAYPVCNRSSGSYGSCRGVEQSYSATSWRDARQRVARDCAAANNPDPCNCARQCSQVAQCGPV